jgi:hypothetical protein
MGIKERASKAVEGIKKEANVVKGTESKDKVYTSTREFDDVDAAIFEFARSRERLFNVNGWSRIPGIANATFELFSKDGQPLGKYQVEIGDFIKIDLPGPLPHYWVKVIDIKNERDKSQFTVQPSHNPTEGDDRNVTDHFFKAQARSTFSVERNNGEITAMEIGENEAINNQDGEAGNKSVINTLVSEGGWAGFQRYQWKNLTEYLVGLRSPAK